MRYLPFVVLFVAASAYALYAETRTSVFIGGFLTGLSVAYTFALLIAERKI